MSALWRHGVRLLSLIVLSALALQLYFVARVGLMTVVDPQSTTFQRSEIRRLVAEQQQLLWSQQWVGRERISDHLKRAVIASEDASFVDHSGVEWDALEKAWEKNQRAEAQAEKINERLARQATRSQRPAAVKPPAVPKIVGGSTITQQLAKNLFLAGERNLARKGQEFLITFMLEALLSKQRILEIYLNNVEWGEGLFGAEAAARHYFHVSASQLGSFAAARLAVMLPAPKRFEKRPGSAYVMGRAATVAARMGAVELP
ncbi:MAG TPA: transglycosylase domain-containing protein [Rhizobacter sp.]|nr:transglycosylase domain-containing protein [Rhizobacter sp.]